MEKKDILYRFLAFIIIPVFRFRYRPIITGLENLDDKGPVILVANHKSNFDFINLAFITKRQVHFLAKDSLFRGITGPILNHVGAIPVHRDKKDKKAVDCSLKALEEGKVIGIFPEGTFNRTNELLAPFKVGAVKMAYEKKIPITPVLIGNYKRKKHNIIIMKPIYVKSDDLLEETKKLRELMMKRLVR